jgi:hypothetical protein
MLNIPRSDQTAWVGVFQGDCDLHGPGNSQSVRGSTTDFHVAFDHDGLRAFFEVDLDDLLLRGLDGREEAGCDGNGTTNHRFPVYATSLRMSIQFALFDLYLHFNSLQRHVSFVAVGFNDFVDDIHSFDDFSKHGVFVVERGDSVDHDEELGSGGVGVLGASHAEDSSDVLDIVEFGFEVVSGSACAGNSFPVGLCIWASALDYKLWNDSVKCGAVVETLIGEFDEAGDVLWGFFGEKFEFDISESRLDNRDIFGFRGYDGGVLNCRRLGGSATELIRNQERESDHDFRLPVGEVEMFCKNVEILYAPAPDSAAKLLNQ